MNILFDGCVPRPLRKYLIGHNVKTAQENNWSELRNGDLLQAAENQFDVFVTSDKNIRYQQNLAGRRIAITVLPTNHWPVLRLMTDRIAATINQLKPGDFVEIEPDLKS